MSTDAFKKCISCSEWLPPSAFHRDKYRPDGRRASCKKCRNLHLNNYRGAVKTWGERAYKTRYRAMRKGWDHDLTPEFLEKLWDEQKGECFYTGIPMVDRLGGAGRLHNSVSIDRVDSLKGYTQDNVVLACTHANTLKSNLTLEELRLYFPLWADKITDYLKGK